MICPAMNSEPMVTFLAQVSETHPKDFIVMDVDGASSSVAKALLVPENMRLHRLPGYSPELNPSEHLWFYRERVGAEFSVMAARLMFANMVDSS
jgi:transposase